MATIKTVNRFRYFCFGCTKIVLYAQNPFPINFAICPHCFKEHNNTNYKEENWLPLSEQEFQEVNR